MMGDAVGKIAALVNGGCWEEAVDALKAYLSAHSMDDKTAVLAATIYAHYGMREQEMACIENGLSVNPCNYELYFLLGDAYSGENPDLAYLCYENALHHCRKQQARQRMMPPGNDISQDGDAPCGEGVISPTHCPGGVEGEAAGKAEDEYGREGAGEEDLCLIESRMAMLREQECVHVRPASIVILSYNTLEYTKLCIESIRDTCPPEAYELVLVDNGSQDGSREWLEVQPDMKLVLNAENRGYPAGCNQGIRVSAPGNDIFLLNNDTILPQNALYTLRMGLYASRETGASGAVSNEVANFQRIELVFPEPASYMEYGEKLNIPARDEIEWRNYLIGFALLVKRTVLDAVGLLDERFSPGNYEDTDLCLRIYAAGYRLALCHNCFIFHFGSKSFLKDHSRQSNLQFSYLLLDHKLKFIEKWGFHIATVRKELAMQLKERRDAAFALLEIGCSTGATLGYLHYCYPRAALYGLESNTAAAAIGARHWDIRPGNAETGILPYSESFFDYILLGDFADGTAAEALAGKVSRYLKAGGTALARVPASKKADGDEAAGGDGGTCRDAQLPQTQNEDRFLYFTA